MTPARLPTAFWIPTQRPEHLDGEDLRHGEYTWRRHSRQDLIDEDGAERQGGAASARHSMHATDPTMRGDITDL